MAKAAFKTQALTGTETANAMMLASQNLAQPFTSMGMGLNRIGAALEKGMGFDQNANKSKASASQDPMSNEAAAAKDNIIEGSGL